MNSFELCHGTEFGFLPGDIAPRRTGALIFLDQLPPCACGQPADDVLLRVAYTLSDARFTGLRILQGDEPCIGSCFVLRYFSKPDDMPLWLAVDLSSIAGAVFNLLLKEVLNGTVRSEEELMHAAMRTVKAAHKQAGRMAEYEAAVRQLFETNGAGSTAP